MARRSTIEQLPQALFDAVNAALNEGKTIDQVVEHLKAMGGDVSKSAVGRHKKKIDQVAERIRNSRMIAEAVGREFGDKADDKMAAVNIELLHDQVMRFISTAEDGEEASMDAKELNFIADALYRLASASKIDADRIVKVRKETAEKAAKVVDQVLKKTPGLTAETVADIRKRVLGVAE